MLDYLAPLLEPLRDAEFSVQPRWLRDQATHAGQRPANPAASLGRRLNLPPGYLLIHRVTMGGLGILCQLGSTVPVRTELGAWLPGFAAEDADEERRTADQGLKTWSMKASRFAVARAICSSTLSDSS